MQAGLQAQEKIIFNAIGVLHKWFMGTHKFAKNGKSKRPIFRIKQIELIRMVSSNSL
jgi:hypothetical protein